ncbi:uncharacterized protein SCHCODRAFT_02620967 [Schizophyllum commune H4-8]|uniref:uncharacterized protein n=1 Tax=Schizophyllum commune (strain H4-8 / FGSC 9210) TaxID=578458 RepID=UPI0021600014|nr:uncharacterized protein SCHCODRAFT_02620967 [Schizophyllum commune H4-8]KAI5893136.1 hypothetical protein SCHCODRAFT_02620967 [Schizophyllum commune H4-8]
MCSARGTRSSELASSGCACCGWSLATVVYSSKAQKRPSAAVVTRQQVPRRPSQDRARPRRG